MMRVTKRVVEKVHSPNLLDALQDELNGFLGKGMDLKQAVAEYNWFPFEGVNISLDEVLSLQTEKLIVLKTRTNKAAKS
jgi:hypothetical protein